MLLRVGVDAGMPFEPCPRVVELRQQGSPRLQSAPVHAVLPPGRGQIEPAARLDAREMVADVIVLAQRELGNHARRLAVVGRPNRIVLVPQEGPVRSGQRGLVGRMRTEQPGKPHVAGKFREFAARLLSFQIIDDRPDERPVLQISWLVFNGRRVSRHAGHRIGHAVHRVFMHHRAHDRHPVHDLRRARQTFDDLQARHGGGNGVHLAADFFRRLRLGIERLELRGRAEQKQQNAGLRAAERARGRFTGHGLQRI